MKHLGRLAALLGLLGAVWIFWRGHPREVFALMRTAGLGLVLAGLLHILGMLVNAVDWRTLIRGRRPGLAAMLLVVWIRESINNLLPVARIGGELASFRLMRALGQRASVAAATLVVDLQLTVISQLLFTLVGVGYLLTQSAASGALHLAGNVAWGLVAAVPVLAGFALAVRASPFERVSRLLNRVVGGKLAALVGTSARIDRQIMLIWQRTGVVVRYVFLWQLLQNLACTLEIWAALYFLHSPVSFLKAVALEALIQAVSSAAFFVPGGLGVQEGGFVLIGRALGLDPATSLALAGARRIRDVVVFLPGLVAWQVTESRIPAAAGRPN